MKDVQKTAEGANSALQNMEFLFWGDIFAHIYPHPDQKYQLLLAEGSEIQQIFMHKNIYHNLKVKLPYLMNHAKHGQKIKITFEIFFKVFTFHKSPLGTKSVQNLHDDAVQGLVRNCLCLLCTEYTVKCTVYLLCTCGCGQATEYIQGGQAATDKPVHSYTNIHIDRLQLINLGIRRSLSIKYV